MGTFRRVEAELAGPSALGILVPPGKRTFLILRPRGLPWDAVLCRSAEDPTFAQLGHDEASAAAQGLHRALRDREEVHFAGGESMRILVGPFALVVCERRPGQPYSPLAGNNFAEVDRLLRAILCPAGDQEVYFNVRYFER